MGFGGGVMAGTPELNLVAVADALEIGSPEYDMVMRVMAAESFMVTRVADTIYVPTGRPVLGPDPRHMTQTGVFTVGPPAPPCGICLSMEHGTPEAGGPILCDPSVLVWGLRDAHQELRRNDARIDQLSEELGHYQWALDEGLVRVRRHCGAPEGA